MITIAHRIQLMPNNKQRTYFRKAIGCCRFAYNWGLEEWKRRYKEGEQGLSGKMGERRTFTRRAGRSGQHLPDSDQLPSD